jgi:hypothetical protein
MSKTIRVKLNHRLDEIREVTAERIRYPKGGGSSLIIRDIYMTTLNGNVLHRGWIEFRENDDPGHVYTIIDMLDIRYHGMRGNGGARGSYIKYMGWASPADTGGKNVNKKA